METKLKAEQWLFVLFVFTLPFAASFNFFGAPVQISDLVFLATAIVWSIAFVTRRGTLRFDRFYVCLAAYAIAVTLSTITSDDPTQSSVKLAGKFLLIGIAFVTYNIVNSFAVMKRAVQAWLLSAGVMLFLCLLGVILFYAGLHDPAQNFVVHEGYGSLPPGNYPRIEGFFSYPAILCNFLAVTWMLMLSSRSAGWIRRPLFWPIAAALFIVDAFTLTPGLGGIFLATGIFLREKLTRRPGRFAVASGLLIATAFLFVTTYIPFTNNHARTARIDAWQTAFATFLHDPFLGRGVGMPVAYAQFTDPSGATRLLTDAHNTYLSLLGETGLVGFATFLSIVFVATWNLLDWKPAKESFKTIRLCLLLAMLDAFLYQSLTGSFEDARHIWVLFGMAAAAKLMQNGECTMHDQ